MYSLRSCQLKAAELYVREGFVNSAASRVYFAMLQAAQVALEVAGAFQRSEWSHYGLQAAAGKFTRRYFGIILPLDFVSAWPLTLGRKG